MRDEGSIAKNPRTNANLAGKSMIVPAFFDKSIFKLPAITIGAGLASEET
jgi:hypothetical protein